MTDEERKQFPEGYIAGWRSIFNVSPPMPTGIPECKLTGEVSL